MASLRRSPCPHRLVGGRLTTAELASLLAVSKEYADGTVHLTTRANLQLRALPRDPVDETRLHPEALAAIESTGLLPSRTHELVRNILVSPQTGLDAADGDGRANLRPVGTSNFGPTQRWATCRAASSSRSTTVATTS